MKNLKNFKNDLSYVPLKVVLKNGDKVSGRLANQNFEEKIIESAAIPFPLEGEYICLVNEEKNRASYLLIGEIESIKINR